MGLGPHAATPPGGNGPGALLFFSAACPCSYRHNSKMCYNTTTQALVHTLCPVFGSAGGRLGIVADTEAGDHADKGRPRHLHYLRRLISHSLAAAGNTCCGFVLPAGPAHAPAAYSRGGAAAAPGTAKLKKRCAACLVATPK